VIFGETEIRGVWVIEVERHEDERGFFARTWDSDEFARRKLDSQFDQCSISQNHLAGTLRGLHYQAAPHGEVKLVRCTAGAIFDVALDLRPDSATFERWSGVDLTRENRRALYVPRGCAHGFLTLENDTEVSYQISGRYVPAAATGARWDDPAFRIGWPREVAVINQRDASYPNVADEAVTP